MKIAVVIKQVPDTETRIVVAQNGRTIDDSSVTWIVNPYDEYAIEEALRIKEAKGEGEVVVLTVGPARAATALRTCLAMGADRGVHLIDPAFDGSDSLGLASILAAAIKGFAPDLVLAGQYAVGSDNRQVGMMLAELLAMPHVSVVTKLELKEGGLVAHREIEGAHEVVEAPLPCVVTAQKGLNEPRYASLKGIMAAKKKPIEEKDAAALGLDRNTTGESGAKVRISKLELPPPKQAGKVFKDDVDTAVREVVRLLHEEAKVL
ncbi:MAG TPA: electron transfer flavoprotein subunit beta/FixA family protein [Candidatus Polarisedimenticolia bacterium]